jgi:predicted AAA+ superfamily ATPase
MKLSGFPDPLLKGSEQRAQRWSRLRLDSLINQDIRDEKAIQDIQAFRNLVSLLPEKISGTFSLNATKEDVGAAYATVRAWMVLLHDFYYCFSIKPYSKKIKRSLLAEPKVYLYDLLQISKTNPGQRRENLVALHLLKACHFWTDTAQGEFELHYLRDKEKREVDFLITNDRKPWMLIECKSNSKEISKSLIYFKNILQIEHVFQLVSDSKYHREYPALGIQVIGSEKFFSNWI